MARTIRLLIAYDGSEYQGWQRQCQGPTIQGELEDKLRLLCGAPTTLHGAGRTDAGVHALGMVAHFHCSAFLPVAAFEKGLNAMLPKSIRIVQAQEVHSSFHSRFSALGKTYRYDFFTGAVMPPTLRLYKAHCAGTFVPQRLAVPLRALVGIHDFSSFERSGSRDKDATSGRGAVRTMFHASCRPQVNSPGCWSIRLTADGFLRQMVRILAGTLIQIGLGKRDEEEFVTILNARDRNVAGPTAPAQGLFLEKIYYSTLPPFL